MCDYKAKDLLFNERAKSIVRKPLGIAIFEEAKVAIKHAKTLIEDFKPPVVATIGDVVTRNFINYGQIPDIALIDFKTRRRKLREAELSRVLSLYDNKLSITNPRSTIAKETWNTLTEAVNKVINQRIKCLIIVDGEEDLLTLSLSILAPDRSFIFYGQPDQALVLVIVSQYVRNAFSDFLCKLAKQL
mgnify:CR=1 FL=1